MEYEKRFSTEIIMLQELRNQQLTLLHLMNFITTRKETGLTAE